MPYDNNCVRDVKKRKITQAVGGVGNDDERRVYGIAGVDLPNAGKSVVCAPRVPPRFGGKKSPLNFIPRGVLSHKSPSVICLIYGASLLFFHRPTLLRTLLPHSGYPEPVPT